nr:MAG TPA_asm: hypothetical protein [Caudoviricetes sp.]
MAASSKSLYQVADLVMVLMLTMFRTSLRII